MSTRIKIGLAIIVVALLITGGWIYATSGREVTDDAQVDAHIVPIAARVGGTVVAVPVTDNQQVEAGALLVAVDPRDYQIALDKAQAELADAEAAFAAARANVPLTSTTTSSGVSTAQGGVEQAQASVEEATHGIEVARARLVTAQARQREAEAVAIRTSKDVERFRGLLAKDEISQQQFDAAMGASDAARAGADSAKSQVVEAELGIRGAESRLAQAQASSMRAASELRGAQTGPEQLTMTRARASAAEAKVQQMKAAVSQAELNLEHASVKAPVAGIVSRKTVEAGQVIQAGQPLMTVIPLEQVWVVANFKETQLRDMRPGQRAVIEVDAYGGREYTGKVESLAAATGARFSLIPPDNATGNFVKVVQRVPVKIAIDSAPGEADVLRPGLSVTATVYTDGRP
ncbi:MAG: HlyD family secretion protein [Vicinamibacterales bacterium]